MRGLLQARPFTWGLFILMELETKTVPVQPHWALAARLVAAIPANYALTALVTACLARLLPLSAAEATVAAMLASFAIFAVIVLVALVVQSVWRLWLWVLAAMALSGGLLWLSLLVEVRA